MKRQSPLDNPEYAAFAWAKFKRLMRIMMALTVFMVAAACIVLYRTNSEITVSFYIAMALGISFTMLLTSGLMGLMFLSSGTGHDEAVGASSKDDDDQTKS